MYGPAQCAGLFYLSLLNITFTQLNHHTGPLISHNSLSKIVYLCITKIEFHNWKLGSIKLKLFFHFLLYSILVTMYTVHLIETTSQIVKSYIIVEKPKKETEATMKKDTLQQEQVSKTKSDKKLNTPVSHS